MNKLPEHCEEENITFKSGEALDFWIHALEKELQVLL